MTSCTWVQSPRRGGGRGWALQLPPFESFESRRGLNPVWTSNTWGNPGAFLSVQSDGNLVVYTPSTNAVRWASNTSRY